MHTKFLIEKMHNLVSAAFISNDFEVIKSNSPLIAFYVRKKITSTRVPVYFYVSDIGTTRYSELVSFAKTVPKLAYIANVQIDDIDIKKFNIYRAYQLKRSSFVKKPHE